MMKKTTMKGRWRIKMWNSQVAWRPTVNLAPHHVTLLSSSIIVINNRHHHHHHLHHH